MGVWGVDITPTEGILYAQSVDMLPSGLVVFVELERICEYLTNFTEAITVDVHFRAVQRFRLFAYGGRAKYM